MTIKIIFSTFAVGICIMVNTLLNISVICHLLLHITEDRQCTSWHSEAACSSSLAAATLVICATHLYSEILVVQVALPCVGWRVTACQFDLWSPPLSVAGCGQLQLGAPHLPTSVALLQVVNN